MCYGAYVSGTTKTSKAAVCHDKDGVLRSLSTDFFLRLARLNSCGHSHSTGPFVLKGGLGAIRTCTKHPDGREEHAKTDINLSNRFVGTFVNMLVCRCYAMPDVVHEPPW